MKKKATNSEILKQVIYEMLTLAHAVEHLVKKKWVKGYSHIDSSEPILSITAIKMSILYDFLYTKKADQREYGTSDYYTAIDDFNVKIPVPKLAGCGPKGMFTKESVIKHIVYLSEERITKSKEVQEPRFKGGVDSILKNCSVILSNAEFFIDTLVTSSFINLNLEGENYLKDYKLTIARLKEVPTLTESF